MRKLLLIMICTLLIPLCSNTTSAYAWCEEEHKKLVRECSPCARLSPSQTNLAVYCSILPDKGIFRKSLLHGTGDYEKCLELLYTCAFNLKNNVENPMESALDTSCKDPGYLKIYKFANRILLDEVLPGEEEKTNSAKAAKILGIACHLLADVYAHRTIIPQEVTEADFKEGWQNWKESEIAKNPKLAKKLPSFEKILGDTFKEGGKGRTLIDKGKANFLMIKEWRVKKLLNRNYFSYLARAFEDNPTFYKQRYELGAMESTQNMMTLFGENIPFCADAILVTECNIPIEPSH